VAAIATGVAGAASPYTVVKDDFAGPTFGLAHIAGNGFLVSDAGAGPTVVEGNGASSLINALPGVNDAVPVGAGNALAVRTEPFPSGLYHVTPTGVQLLADIGAFEAAVDPAQDGVESNPFDLEHTTKLKAVVADAAGNSLLTVNGSKVDWIASFPNEAVECLIFICGQPGVKQDADPVPTSVAIGPDGAYYVGELKGFPAAPGTSKVWRIEGDALHANCATSPKCKVVGTGFTSVIDLVFGPKGKLYVVELDENGWLAAEEGFGAGGTINECTVGGTLSCTQRATGLPGPTAVAFSRPQGRMHATLLDFATFSGSFVRIP
jgi:hypothetical protein